jgi:hypothetical protein
MLHWLAEHAWLRPRAITILLCTARQCIFIPSELWEDIFDYWDAWQCATCDKRMTRPKSKGEFLYYPLLCFDCKGVSFFCSGCHIPCYVTETAAWWPSAWGEFLIMGRTTTDTYSVTLTYSDNIYEELLTVLAIEPWHTCFSLAMSIWSC